jgi:hypothetical protein
MTTTENGCECVLERAPRSYPHQQESGFAEVDLGVAVLEEALFSPLHPDGLGIHDRN